MGEDFEPIPTHIVEHQFGPSTLETLFESPSFSKALQGAYEYTDRTNRESGLNVYADLTGHDFSIEVIAGSQDQISVAESEPIATHGGLNAEMTYYFDFHFHPKPEGVKSPIIPSDEYEGLGDLNYFSREPKAQPAFIGVGAIVSNGKVDMLVVKRPYRRISDEVMDDKIKPGLNAATNQEDVITVLNACGLEAFVLQFERDKNKKWKLSPPSRGRVAENGSVKVFTEQFGLAR